MEHHVILNLLNEEGKNTKGLIQYREIYANITNDNN